MSDWAISSVVNLAAYTTTAGLGFAVWQLRTNHDWNRRHYTATLLDLWDVRTSHHRREIDRLFPEFVDLGEDGKLLVMSPDRAKSIYDARPETPDWELRFHLIELLNHFETVAAAYNYNVADRAMLRASLMPVLVRWHKLLQHFIERVAAERGYKPWEPYTDIVARWTAPAQRGKGPTGAPF